MKQKKDRFETIQSWTERHLAARFLTSHVSLAFFYGIFLFLYEIAFLKGTVTVVHPILIAWAGALFVYDLAVRKIWQRVPFWQPLALFALAAGLTAVMNRETGLGSCLKTCVMTILPLCAFYPLCLLESRENRNKALIQALLGSAMVMFLASAVSIGMYLIRYSKTITVMGVTKWIGYRYYIPNNKNSGVILFGVYSDTNHASVYALVFAVYSVFLFLACRKGMFRRGWQNLLGKMFAAANILVQLCYFPLANSRGGWLSLIVAGILVLFLYFNCARFTDSRKWRRALKAVCAALLCTAVVCGGILVIRSCMQAASAVVCGVYEAQANGTDKKPSGNKTEQKVENTNAAQDTFAKKDDGLGAGRLTLWKETLQLYTKNPVLGIGPGNSQHYAQKYDFGQKLRNGKAVHNSYLDLLLDYGVVGFGLLIAFWAACLWTVLKTVWCRGGEKDAAFYAAGLAVVLIAGASALLSCVFVSTTAMYYLLLIPTGYLMARCGKTD